MLASSSVHLKAKLGLGTGNDVINSKTSVGDFALIRFLVNGYSDERYYSVFLSEERKFTVLLNSRAKL